jgi:hypothetical protein
MIFFFSMPIWLAIIIWIVQVRSASARNKALQQQVARTLEQLRKCPECAELIQREAKLCRICGSKVEPLIEVRPQLQWRGMTSQTEDMWRANMDKANERAKALERAKADANPLQLRPLE